MRTSIIRVDAQRLPMHQRQPHWSQTSQRLFTECSRAWAHQYAFLEQGKPFRRVPSRPRTFDDLTVRVARSIWIERLSDQYQRKVWSDIYRRRRISSTVDEMLWNTRMDVSELRKATAIHQIAEQLRTLEQSSMLRTVFGDCLLYTSPSPRDQRGSRMPSSA